MNEPRPPLNADDPLLQRYREASALDPARPDPALRERVLARAREQAAQNAQAPTSARPRSAANDSVWTLRALGSLAVLGLVGLLALQFDRGTPEEREAAFGHSAPKAALPAAAPSTAAQAPVAAAPAMAPAAPTPALKPVPDAPPPQREWARKAAPVPPSLPAPAETAPLSAPASAPAPAPAAAAAIPPSPARAESASPAPASAAESPAMADAPALAPAPAAPPAPRAMARMASPAAPSVADGAAPDPLGRTPLMQAAARGDAERVEQLLAAGADLSARDRRGWTAADHARHAGHPALARRLEPPPAPPVNSGADTGR